MYVKILSQADLKLVTLAEAKAQCRVMDSFTMDDTYIESLIDIASSLAQSYCNKLLTLGSVAGGWTEYASEITLWGGDATVTAVTAENGTVDITDFEFHEITQKLTIPSQYSELRNFDVTYDCGLISPTPRIKQGVLMMVSTFYNNRDDAVVGLSIEEMPMTSRDILNADRHYHAA